MLKSSRAVRPDGCSGAHSAQDDEHPTTVLAHPFSSAESSAFYHVWSNHYSLRCHNQILNDQILNDSAAAAPPQRPELGSSTEKAKPRVAAVATVFSMFLALHGPNALVWKRQPCAFRRCRLVHRKLCCIKFRTSRRLPEPSEDSLRTQPEKTSTVKACLHTHLSSALVSAPRLAQNGRSGKNSTD